MKFTVDLINDDLYQIGVKTGNVYQRIDLGTDDLRVGTLAFSTITGQILALDNEPTDPTLIQFDPNTGDTKVFGVILEDVNIGGMVFEPTTFAGP